MASELGLPSRAAQSDPAHKFGPFSRSEHSARHSPPAHRSTTPSRGRRTKASVDPTHRTRSVGDETKPFADDLRRVCAAMCEAPIRMAASHAPAQSLLRRRPRGQHRHPATTPACGGECLALVPCSAMGGRCLPTLRTSEHLHWATQMGHDHPPKLHANPRRSTLRAESNVHTCGAAHSLSRARPRPPGDKSHTGRRCDNMPIVGPSTYAQSQPENVAPTRMRSCACASAREVGRVFLATLARMRKQTRPMA